MSVMHIGFGACRELCMREGKAKLECSNYSAWQPCLRKGKFGGMPPVYFTSLGLTIVIGMPYVFRFADAALYFHRVLSMSPDPTSIH